jgi:hypothetical protein
MKTAWTASNIPSQQGRRVVITGGNSGIGFPSLSELQISRVRCSRLVRTCDRRLSHSGSDDHQKTEPEELKPSDLLKVDTSTILVDIYTIPSGEA